MALNQSYINLLDRARRAHASYFNALRTDVEATRAVGESQQAVLNVLGSIVEDADLNRSLAQLRVALGLLVDAQIQKNAGLFDSMRARINMERMLVIEDVNLASHVPVRKEVRDALEFYDHKFKLAPTATSHLDRVLRTVHRSEI